MIDEVDAPMLAQQANHAKARGEGPPGRRGNAPEAKNYLKLKLKPKPIRA